jgi:hypothetical protein
MEEYEEQEQEFWGRLAETDMSRSQMLKRRCGSRLDRPLDPGRGTWRAQPW